MEDREEEEFECVASTSRVDESESELNSESGWDAIQSFFVRKNLCYTNKNNELVVRKRKKDDRSEFINRNAADLNKILSTENVQLKVANMHRKSIQCPLCDLDFGTISSGAAVKQLLERLKEHMVLHNGDLDVHNEKVCPICYLSFSNNNISNHLKEAHPDSAIKLPSQKYNIVMYTTQLCELTNFLNALEEKAKLATELKIRVPNEKVHKRSCFKGYRMRVNIKGYYCLVVDEYEQDHDEKVLFQYKVLKNKKIPYRWVCGLCDMDTACSLPHTFRNDISLRLFVLRHFASSHADNLDVQETCAKEWKRLTKDCGLDLTKYGEWKSRFEQKHRSVFFHVEDYQESNKNLITEMIGRSSNQDEFLPSESVICLICLNQVHIGRLVSHFSSNSWHVRLQTHSEKSEFRCVQEIAEQEPMTQDQFPLGLLRYSKVYVVKELDDSQSLLSYKWRCPLSSNRNGHFDDILHFPTEALLRLYALKHFESFHPGLFSDELMKYEWNLLTNQLRLPLNLRVFDPMLIGDDFEIDDPNDYQFPWSYELLPPSAKKFHICGFCFWSGLAEHFLDHISIHGFIYNRKRLLCYDELRAMKGSLLKKKDFKPLEVGSIPKKLFGSHGKLIRREMFRVKIEVDSPTKAFISDVKEEIHSEGRYHEEASNLPEENLNDSEMTNEEPANVTLRGSPIATAQSDVLSSGGKEPSRRSPRTAAKVASTKITKSIGALKEKINADDTIDSTSCDSSDSDMEIRDTASSSEDDCMDYKNEEERLVSPLDSSISPDNIFDMSQTESSCIDDSASNYTESRVLKSMNYCADAERLELVKENLAWHGEPPSDPTYDEIKVLEMMKERRCSFCPKPVLVKTSLMASFLNGGTEDSLLAHFILRHFEEETVQSLLNRRKYLMSVQEPFNPTVFLLDQEGILVCSCCKSYKSDRLSMVADHFNRCTRRAGYKESTLKRSAPISTQCCLDGCRLRVRASSKYPAEITQLIHLVGFHRTDKDAYEKAVQLNTELNLDKSVPFLGVVQSFKETVTSGVFTLVCNICGFTFRTPQELLQHAIRYHAPQHVRCFFGCAKKGRRRANSANVSYILHALKHHYQDDRMEDFLNKHVDIELIKKEKIFRFDAMLSLIATRERNEPCLVCLMCGEIVADAVFHQHTVKCFRIGAKAEQTLIELASTPTTPKPTGTPLSLPSNIERITCELCHKSFCIAHSKERSIFFHIIAKHKNHPKALEWINQLDITKFKDENVMLDFEKTVANFLTSDDPTPNVFFCSQCDKGFDNFSHLLGHFSTHMSLKGSSDCKYSSFCGLCQRKLKQSAHYNNLVLVAAHVIEKHCDIRGLQLFNSEKKKYLNENAPFIDIEKSIASKKLACSQCDNMFRNIKNMIPHAFAIHNAEYSLHDDDEATPSKNKSTPKTSANSSVRKEESLKKTTPSKVSSDPLSDTPRRRTPRLAENCKLNDMKGLLDSDSTPKSARRNLCSSLDFDASVSSDTTTNNSTNEGSDKAKWMETFSRYSKIETQLRVKSAIMNMKDKNAGKSQSRITAFIGTKTETPQTPQRVEIEAAQDITLSVPHSSPGKSNSQKVEVNTPKSTKNWLTIQNTVSTVTPSAPAQRLSLPPTGKKSGTNSSSSFMNLDDALGSVLEPSPSVKYRTNSLLSLLPSTSIEEMPSHDSQPVDVSHVNGVSGYKCAHCSYVGLKITDVSKHMNQIHAAAGFMFNKPVQREVLSQCIICKKILPNRKKLFMHINLAHNDVPNAFPCSFCGKGFNTVQRVREHERRMHEQSISSTTNELKCSHCSMVFQSVRNKKAHEYRHQ